MTYEYRLFIVDGRPVTGAGCIVEHTPLFADHRPGSSPFSPLVRRKRGVSLTAIEDELDEFTIEDLDSGTWADESASADPSRGGDIENAPGLVTQLVEFGAALVAEGLTDGVLPRAYVLDVALNEGNGKPLAIEVNGLSNSGLYASKPWIVTRALLDG